MTTEERYHNKKGMTDKIDIILDGTGPTPLLKVNSEDGSAWVEENWTDITGSEPRYHEGWLVWDGNDAGLQNLIDAMRNEGLTITTPN